MVKRTLKKILCITITKVLRLAHSVKIEMKENWGLILVLSIAAINVMCHWQFKNYLITRPWRLPNFFNLWKNLFLKYHSNCDPTGLARGIFLGDDSSLSFYSKDTFRNAGLAHILAASGYNCMIVGALFTLPLMLLNRSCPTIAQSLRPLCWSSGAALFWCWSDQSPPVSRATSYVLLKTALFYTGIDVPFLRLVLIQYGISLLIWPRQFNQAGFQLSYACLLGMALGMGLSLKIKNFITSFKYKLFLSAIISYICCSLGAILLASPLTWIYFGEINLNGFLSNLIAGPVVSLIIMPLGLVIMFLALFNLFMGDFLDLSSFAIFLARTNGTICTLLSDIIVKWMGYAPNLQYAPYR